LLMEPANKTKNIMFAIFFWTFNGMLLLIIYAGVLPFLGISLVGDAIAGLVPLNFMVTFVGLVTVPTTCSILGTKAKKWQRITLFQLFYGIEAPLLIACIARFFWLRDLTVPSTFLLLTMIFGTIATAHWLISRRDNPMAVNLWHLAGQTLMLAIAVYLTALAAFYVLPSLTIMGVLIVMLYSIILMPVTVFALGLFTLPFGMVAMYLRSWRETLKQLGTRYGEWRVSLFSAVILAGWLITFALLQEQPQVKAFRLLNNPPQTDRERQELLQKSDTIRTGLLNAYLSSYRYPLLENTQIKDLYQHTLKFPEAAAQTVQNWYNFLTIPFTYQGTKADTDKANKLYAEFFDAPILRQENAAIQKALGSTFDRSGAKAGLDNINQKRVFLEEQKISVTPQGNWADVEIYEVYQNRTTLPEEILYYFSLPESAAITGVWLSDDAKIPKKYPFTISPRGAAQQVYNNQVVRNVDPALLEQVGPQQYRLRAFPVPPIGQTWQEDGTSTNETAKMYLWLRYKVLKQDAGWQLPELREQRNIFWNKATKRIINGKGVSGSDRWLPATLPADKTPPTAQQMTLPWGASILATPFGKNDYQLPQGKRFAVILDSSRSMAAHRQEVAESFRWLKENILKQNTADLYVMQTGVNQPQRVDIASFDPTKVAFYGMVQPKDMLAQFERSRQRAGGISRAKTDYDAILAITDAGSYELNDDRKLTFTMPAPLWFVHLGGLAFAYDDTTLKAIQDSDGGVATNVQTAMQRIGTQPSRGVGTSFLNLVDGYAWYLTKDAVSATPANEGFGALAARQWTTHLSRYLQPNEMKELDAIHAAAKRYGIVTPYSSMIVLVNDQQRQELKQAEQQSDRFNREVEDKQLPQPSNNEISAVPEPAEWLLLIFAAVALWGIYHYQKTSQISA
jgi:putative PEP-CTERM system integral membrane protein